MIIRETRIYKSIVKAGREAYYANADVDDNPYAYPGWQRHAWHEGWTEARDEECDAGQAVSTSP